METIAAWQRGEQHRSIAAMLSPSKSREIHYSGIETRRGRTLAAMLDEWERTQAGLMTALHGLSDDEWRDPAPTNPSMNLGGALEIILVAPPRPVYRHLPVHIPDTEAYVRGLRDG